MRDVDPPNVVDDVLLDCVEDATTPLDIALEVITLLIWLDCREVEVAEPPANMDKSTAASTPGLEELL